MVRTYLVWNLYCGTIAETHGTGPRVFFPGPGAVCCPSCGRDGRFRIVEGAQPYIRCACGLTYNAREITRPEERAA